MKLDSDRPVPLALFPAPCAWRQLAHERLQSAGRHWTVALQSTGLSGIITAVEAGLAILIFAQSGLSPRLRALGPAQGLPALPDFEYVVRRNAKPSLAADRLRDVIIDYFRLAAALRRTSENTNTQTAERGRVRSAISATPRLDFFLPWLPSAGEDFFVIFRFYGSAKSLYEKTWSMRERRRHPARKFHRCASITTVRDAGPRQQSRERAFGDRADHRSWPFHQRKNN
jgi:hypothetical protein